MQYEYIIYVHGHCSYPYTTCIIRIWCMFVVILILGMFYLPVTLFTGTLLYDYCSCVQKLLSRITTDWMIISIPKFSYTISIRNDKLVNNLVLIKLAFVVFPLYIQIDTYMVGWPSWERKKRYGRYSLSLATKKKKVVFQNI